MTSREEPGQNDRVDSAPHGRNTFAGANRAEPEPLLAFHCAAWLSGDELGEGMDLGCMRVTRIA